MAKVNDILQVNGFKLMSSVINNKEINGILATDLLSFAVGTGKEGNIMVTMMCNMNTIAVASLLELPCIIFTYGFEPEENVLRKADSEGITVLTTELSTSDAIIKLSKVL